MKSIDDNAIRIINALSKESDINIDTSAYEKDVHVTDLINTLANIKLEHFDLVFCGGTCLSKAYGIIERMSEDIDFKLVNKPEANIVSKNDLKNKLSAAKHTISELLINLDYVSRSDLDNKDDPLLTARDGNQYILFNVPYLNRYPVANILKSYVQIEINYTSLQMDMYRGEVGYLYNDFIENSSSKNTVFCVSLQEAFCEKLISFPRRYAHAIANNKLSTLDHALVRHLYDIHEIKRMYPDVDKDQDLIKDMMKNIIDKDALEFSNQHQEFVVDPIGQLKLAMRSAISSTSIKRDYDDFLSVMVYQNEDKKPSFEEAINVFNEALNKNLEQVNVLSHSSGFTI